MIFKKYSFDKIDYYLISLLTLLSVLTFEINRGSSIWFLKKERLYESSGLFSLIEFVQLFLLVFNIFLIFKNRHFLIKYTNNLSIVFSRLIIPIFLIYEETSFFLKDFFRDVFFVQLNKQGELNFHNLKFLEIRLFKHIPILGESSPGDDISIKLVFYSFLFIVFGFGAYLPFLKRFSFIFFEKRFLIFVFTYIINMVFSFIFRFFGFINHDLIQDELIEIYYYQLLLLDLRQKIIKIKISS